MPPEVNLIGDGRSVSTATKRDVETDLLHLMEIQRCKQMSDGRYYVGAN
jgi:hypothetical protein